MNSNILALKSLEKLLLAQGFLYCQVSGRKITSPEELALVTMSTDFGQILSLPVHKNQAKELLQIELSNFSLGLPSLEDLEEEEVKYYK